MKAIMSSFQITKRFFSVLILLSITGCSWYVNTQMIVEHDEVKSSTRVKRDFIYKDALEKASPLYYARQTILKETKAHEPSNYTVFEVLNLHSNAYSVDKQAYLLIDSAVYPIMIEAMESENTSSIEEDTDDILAADSTEVSIVTGYTQLNSRKFKLTYSLAPSIIEHLKEARDVKFRYYSGPDMITLKMSNGDVRKLKKLITT
ncbi:hypothetical protein DN752_00935 [Echinicola strongylocentroti]|uniref:Uncharacterized protein n=1 Tax=Echinicola strongylocentroti TaxID=1795355 RepID=A0A2Z4IDC0_9BACT|nr:hypothetical protein [Echinicola strongylocentroti]AWW28810.1 hypothetical protein DN752_00935 [Echinicola strongylocentroti]